MLMAAFVESVRGVLLRFSDRVFYLTGLNGLSYLVRKFSFKLLCFVSSFFKIIVKSVINNNHIFY